jgi:general nucleoside transport system ATP-binding protein
MLIARGISKRYGRALALDGVDFEARPGEIHALLGENGAGKTTLMHVLAGTTRADAGGASLDGRPLSAGSPAAALRAGIATVHQSPLLFERFGWEQNLAFGGFGSPSAALDLTSVAARAVALAARLGFTLPPPGATVEQRSVAERVRLEVLRALSFDPRVLILDEPTSVLAPSELAPFLELLRRLRAEGRIVVLITHKLGEALAVADRITVLRRGRVVARTTPAATSETELARTMIGRLVNEPDASAAPLRAGAPALEIDGLALDADGRRILDRLTLTVARGEIAGIAGVDGNGQVELVEILAGARRPTRGRIRVAAEPLAVIPQNRDVDGLVLDMRLWENVALAPALLARLAPRGWLRRAAAIELCATLLARFGIRAESPAATAASLSGGNRQRLEVARALASEPGAIVAHNICRGLDLAATADVHRALLEFAARGGAVLLISSDLDELLKMCGRLLVMSRGRLRETAAHERSPEQLGLLMAGAWD